jgi:5-methylcytosine-specific restriction endonuclease McrA
MEEKEIKLNSKLKRSVLVLNSTYEAIHICNVKRAIELIANGIAVCEECFFDEYIKTPNTKIRIPAVIRLTSYRKIPRKRVVFSKRNIFIRDNFTCQYCGKRLPPKELTIDHIIPRSKGGRDSWDNVVTSCKSCNNKKGDRTPKQAGLKPLKKPKPPHHIQILGYNARPKSVLKLWKKYIFWD